MHALYLKQILIIESHASVFIKDIGKWTRAWDYDKFYVFYNTMLLDAKV